MPHATWQHVRVAAPQFASTFSLSLSLCHFSCCTFTFFLIVNMNMKYNCKEIISIYMCLVYIYIYLVVYIYIYVLQKTFPFVRAATRRDFVKLFTSAARKFYFNFLNNFFPCCRPFLSTVPLPPSHSTLLLSLSLPLFIFLLVSVFPSCFWFVI